MSRDAGGFYEPGTINMLIMSNMTLSPRAMTRAIITATEAKTAAIQDLDVRGSQSPGINQATGTGTDNVVVVRGAGKAINNTGGHAKMGELIAKAVYQGVTKAILKQNALVRGRNIFHRLMERGIGVFELSAGIPDGAGVSRPLLTKEMENLLLKPEYAAFLKASFAVSDDYEKGLISNLTPHHRYFRDGSVTKALAVGAASRRDCRGETPLSQKTISFASA